MTEKNKIKIGDQKTIRWFPAASALGRMSTNDVAVMTKIFDIFES